MPQFDDSSMILLDTNIILDRDQTDLAKNLGAILEANPKLHITSGVYAELLGYSSRGAPCHYSEHNINVTVMMKCPERYASYKVGQVFDKFGRVLPITERTTICETLFRGRHSQLTAVGRDLISEAASYSFDGPTLIVSKSRLVWEAAKSFADTYEWLGLRVDKKVPLTEHTSR